MGYIRIDRDIFEVATDVTIQTSIGSHATIYISMDIQKHPDYTNYFISMYDATKKFDLNGYSFVGYGSFIKSVDIEFKKMMNLTVRCDVLKDISDRRDEIIEEILNKNNINI